jgi:DnaJ-class molecular chaperone
MDKKILMPKNLTAENGAKAALMGEFFEKIYDPCTSCGGSGTIEKYSPSSVGESLVGCEECGGSGRHERKIYVSWTTIKEIYKKTVELLGT